MKVFENIMKQKGSKTNPQLRDESIEYLSLQVKKIWDKLIYYGVPYDEAMSILGRFDELYQMAYDTDMLIEDKNETNNNSIS